jgi:hypothetical protein
MSLPDISREVDVDESGESLGVVVEPSTLDLSGTLPDTPTVVLVVKPGETNLLPPANPEVQKCPPTATSLPETSVGDTTHGVTSPGNKKSGGKSRPVSEITYAPPKPCKS